jgi:phospholipid/cholesterol/gamma-HCH transport system permease protein
LVLNLLEKIGNKTVNITYSFYEAILFTGVCLAHMLNPKSYNPAMRVVLVKQIYFSAIKILPIFIFIAIFFGTIFIGAVIYFATLYNLEGDIGTILVTFTIKEFAPFFTTLLIALRSSTVINTQIALMSVNKEIDTLKALKIDFIDYLYLPRIISGVISVAALSTLFAIIMLLSGYLFTLFFMNMDFHTYKFILISAISFEVMLVMILKAIAFGFVIMLIPVYSGLKTGHGFTAVPISVLNGMMKLFVSIFFVEVLSLLIQSI